MSRRPWLPLLALVMATGLSVLPAPAQAATSDTSVSVQLRRTATSAPAADGRLIGVYWDTAGPAIPEDTFAVTGRLTEDTGGNGLAGQQVHLFGKKRSQAAPVEVAAPATTDINGYYRFTSQHVIGTTDYYVSFDGDGGVTYNGSDSTQDADPVKVLAMRDLNASKHKVGSRLYFRGNVNPGWGNRKVALQRRTCRSCAWRTVTTRTTGSGGGWSFRVGYPTKVGPVWTYQAVLAAAGDFEKSYSAQLTTRRMYARDAGTR